MRISFILLFIYLYGYSKFSNAYSCSVYSSTLYFSLPVTVYPNTPAGTELGSQTISTGLYKCTYSDYEGAVNSQSVDITTAYAPWDIVNGIRVYPTSVAGIGYALGIYVPNCNNTEIKWLDLYGSSASSQAVGCAKNTFIGKTIPGNLTLKLYKTDTNITIGSGGTAGIIGWSRLLVNNTQVAQTALYLSNFTVTNASCNVNNRSLQVNLDPIYKGSFTGLNSSPSQGTKAFTISVTCLNNTDVKLQLDGASVYNASNGVLSEVSGNNIGVGIQLLYKGQPVTLGQPFSVGNANTALDIPLEARYYQTATTINPGVISTYATFTMTYN